MAESRAQSSTIGNHGVQSLQNANDLQQNFSESNIRDANAVFTHKFDIKSENVGNFVTNMAELRAQNAMSCNHGVQPLQNTIDSQHN